ncbi:MAG: hypothetical protein OHK0021_09470 [Bryobacter sp.]
MAFTVIPAINNVKLIPRSARPAKPVTSSNTIPAPANPTGQTPASHPKQIAATAPKLAPLETPKVSGVASASRIKAWNSTPAVAKAPPANNANTTRGTLARHKISASGLIPAQALANEISLGPTRGIKTSVAAQTTRAPHNTLDRICLPVFPLAEPPRPHEGHRPRFYSQGQTKDLFQ